MKTIQVGSRLIGENQPCLLVAEIGINHNGDIELARRMIDTAVESGADAVKFQNYLTEDFVSNRSLTYTYKRGGKSVTESQFDMFKRCELSSSQLSELAKHCRRRKTIFFSTPTGITGLRDLQKLRVPLLKNGSDYLGNLPFIRMMAKTKIPTVLSTGMSTLAEMDEAVRAFREAGGRDLLLLHCVSSYPAPFTSVNLKKIPVIASMFGCPVGFSDHTEGTVAALGAVAMGACFIEKHFTSDRNLPGPDQELSSDPLEFSALVRDIRAMEQCLGEPAIGSSAAEAINRRDCRLSCVAAHALSAGRKLRTADVAFRRPGTGLPPRDVDWLLGKTLKQSVPAGEILTLDYLK